LLFKAEDNIVSAQTANGEGAGFVERPVDVASVKRTHDRVRRLSGVPPNRRSSPTIL
jgi:hypothetical protein